MSYLRKVNYGFSNFAYIESGLFRAALKIIFLLFISGSLFPLSAQDTVYFYGSNYRPVRSMEEAKTMQRVSIKRSGRVVVNLLSRDDGQWKVQETYKIRNLGNDKQVIVIKDSPIFSEKIHRTYRMNNGLYEFRETLGEKVIRAGSASSLVPLSLEGEVIEYYQNGQMKSKSIYRNNQLVSNQNWLKDGSEYYDNIFYSVDSIPEYSLGNMFFRNHMLAGIKASKYDYTEVNETIVLGWVITEEGKLVGAQKVSGKSVVLSNILIDIVESLVGDWSPAILDGEPVRYFMTIPFNFMHDVHNFQNIELRGGVLFWD